LLAEEWKKIEETNRHAGDDKGAEKTSAVNSAPKN
jgi:hypothetical protein